MKKRIVILGSTSSIGKSLLNIIKKDKKNFKIELLTANTNYKDLINQAKKFNVKNIIITDPNSFKKTKIICKNKKINIFQNFDDLKKILPKKIDYVMSSISGIGGLLPTFKIIKHTKLIAIANKESIICGWNLIKKELIKNKTKFIPVDSEHFSIWSLVNNNYDQVDEIYITASCGPFLNKKRKSLKNIKPVHAIKHPKWRMGKKISVDSATMVNKVFEIIEASKIFNINIKKVKVLSHPDSYVHAIVKFKNGLFKILIHDTNMKIPIFNTLYNKTNKANFARLHKYKEDTPVISYYFFKTILLFNCNEFIEWCLQKNEPTLNFSQNTKDIHKKIDEFTSFINEQSKNPNFVNKIQVVQKDVQKNKKEPNDIVIYTSLKMTYHNTE